MLNKISYLFTILILTACNGNLPQTATMSVYPSHSQATPEQSMATVTQPFPKVNSTTSGTIDQNETWQGEIHITGDIKMANRATLTILPGTTVYLASNSDDGQMGVGFDDEYTRSHNDPVNLKTWDQNAIILDGRNGIIQAIGTSDQPITFRPEGNSTSPAQWDGIYIERGTLKHAIVLYGGRTAVQILGNSDGASVEIAYNEVRFFHWAGIDSHTTNVWIHHNIVEGGGHQGIGARYNTLVEHNIVTNAQTGIAVEQGNKSIIRNNIVIDCVRGMELRDGRNIDIINNTVAWIKGPPAGWYYQEILIYPAFLNGGGIENYLQTPGITILNNIVYGPFDWGIGLHQQPGEDSVVDYNMMWNQPTPYGGGANSAAGTHNSSQDPLFADPANGNFSLNDGSPAIDAGAPEILDADGSPSNLGAYGGPQGASW
jgi:parallel beta-helix repeat protein